MIKNLPQPKYEESLKMKIAQWAWDSHYWVEDEKGYYHCEWCGAGWTSEMGLDEKYNYLCKKNPLIKKLIK